MAKKKKGKSPRNGAAAPAPAVAEADNTAPAPTGTWDGNAMTQDDMMIKDTVLVLDDDDNVIGSESKKGSHLFNAKTQRGVLVGAAASIDVQL